MTVKDMEEILAKLSNDSEIEFHSELGEFHVENILYDCLSKTLTIEF